MGELRREKEEAYTGQIARLEERVRELSCQQESKTAPPPTPSPSPSIVLPSEKEQSSSSRRKEEERGELEGRIQRLQENHDMLLRTGVYTTDDPVVVSLRTRMGSLPSSTNPTRRTLRMRGSNVPGLNRPHTISMGGSSPTRDKAWWGSERASKTIWDPLDQI